MIEIFTEEEAAKILKIDIKHFARMRRHGEISYSNLGKGEYRYTESDLLEYVKSKRRGKCEESQNLPESEVPNIGTSNITKEEVNASLLGVALARKTMKPTSRSRHLPLNGNAQQQGSRIN